MTALLTGGPEHGSIIEIPVRPPSHIDIEVHEDFVEVPEGGEYLPSEYETDRYVLSNVEGDPNTPEPARYSYLHKLP